MSEPLLVVTEAPTEAEYRAILDPLVAYNRSVGGPSGYIRFAILLKDTPDGAAVGGLAGHFNYDWLFVELLAVPEERRRQGLGSRLLREAEALAKGRGCIGVWLDTYGFQAPGFYLRNGYEVFGELEDFPPGSRRVFLRKRLA